MAELLFYRDDEELMRVTLDGKPCTVGRGQDSDIQIPAPAVSRLQFSVEQRENKWILKDISKKGTTVDGMYVYESTTLKDGAKIGLAQWHAVFCRTSPGSHVCGNSTEQYTRAVDSALEEDQQTPVELHISGTHDNKVVYFKDRAIIGRDGICGIRLSDPKVSGRHLSIDRRGEIFVAQDLGSKNGSFLGLASFDQVRIPLGCKITIGNTGLVLRAVGEKDTVHGMIGQSPAMLKVYDTIERVAPAKDTVFISGESGTGKELAARAIHEESKLIGKFVPLNCGALSPALVESELFGHEKGAFTGADKAHKGVFEEANGGTLFLDEIGDLPLDMQVKLLRFLDLGEVKRVGASTPIRLVVRVVAATNRDLRARVNSGKFREDLYWRLSVISLPMPPLRTRTGDITLLAKYFLRQLSPGGAQIKLAKKAEAQLNEYNWPGNIRELRNAIQLTLLQRKTDHNHVEEIEFDRKREPPTSTTSHDLLDFSGKTLDEIKNEIFKRTLNKTDGNIPEAAKRLGIARNTAWRYAQELGIIQGAVPDNQV